MARANRVLITNSQTKIKIPSGTRLMIRRCCNAVVENEKFPYSAEVSISLVDNKAIRKLNEEFRGNPNETDVLSFPLYEDGDFSKADAEGGAVVLGDIVISIEKAHEQARAYNHSFRRELGFLVVHSMLHLLGHHHSQGEVAGEREELILKQLGLSRTGY